MWVRNADARGTEAVKLSVKWLAGLAVLVLAVVAVVGSTSATKAATGSIFVANLGPAKITNESPAPTGFNTRGTVYATYADTGRLIETDSDFIKVVILDDELSPATPTTITSGNITVTTGGSAQTITAAQGTSAVITLTGRSGSPIAGDLADVIANTQILDGGASSLTDVELKIVGFFAGAAGNDPWIAVTVQTAPPHAIGSITYNTATLGTVEVTVKTELEATGVTLTAAETGLSSGRFEGFVQLVPTTSTSANGTDGSAKGTAATVRTTVGPVTVSFTDSDSVVRESSVIVDTSAPTPSVTGPVSGTATQNTQPTFSGSISESGAGLDVSSIDVLYDNSNDAANSGAVINTGTGALAGGAVSLSVSTTGAVDGDSAFSFSKPPSGPIPSGTPPQPNPDNIVDWVIKASDLAGNIGLSDVDASTTGVQLPTVKIDKVLPTFTATAADHKTGLATSASGEVASRNSLRVAFNDKVTNIQASDFTVTLKSGAVVVPTKATVVNDVTGTFLKTLSTGVGGAQGVVYLEFANDLVSSEAPTVGLQDTISDLAGNFTSTGSKVVGDGIAPGLTVTLSAGSGTGTGSEGPAKLTNDKITVTIETDESLSGSPTVQIYEDDGTPTLEVSPTALAQGANKWTAVYTKPGSPTDGTRAVKVTATDTASNSGSVGDSSASTAGTPSFKLDTALATPAVSVGGGSNTTDQTRPSVVIDYKTPGEGSTVTLTTVQLDGTDITADVVASSDGKRFFYIPPTDLALGDHDLLIEVGDASDAAGNENIADTTLTITIEERDTFNLDLFAGWNALSFPSDPIDPDINSVFTNAGHDAVLGFDPTVPGSWVVSVRDTASGMLEPATENGLTSVRTTQAYWVHSLNFEPVTVLLTGETLPAAGSQPGITTIPTVLGFNAVPVVDTSRKLTTGAAGKPLTRQIPGGGTPEAVTVSTYLGAVTEGRVYKWDPEILSFVRLLGGTAVNTGEVLFVEVTGTPVPIFP
jgi:hypothetical protein